ncbi:hypothetical protein [Nannocystis radixulma]|uniref:HEAT repeat-containing protein n=1 Tax=Nannocystis radixulma TaxID=2995305 RepID=A0ABT5BR20_9BACT|nr:hypothetical protein [Nannocystis radixulma]MDC0676015.1 hypothetical protein [Nannocystis radixulma]
MSQSFRLVSTSRAEPTVRPTVGDVDLAFAGVVSIGYLALFDAAHIHALPWDRTHRQLTLFASKEHALERLVRCTPGVAERLARDLDALADRQASRGAPGGARPSAASLREALEAFARRVESARGTHVQAFLDDSYSPWHEHESAQLAELVSAAVGADPGWSLFRAFSEIANATAPPWRDRDVQNALTGMRSEGPTEDSLASWLAEGELIPGTLAAVFEALGAVFRVHARPPRLAELLGALAQLLGDDVVLRAMTTQGTVTASIPPPAVNDRLPRASLLPLARREESELFDVLREAWALAARGALADGPIECSALARDTGTLAGGPHEPPPAACEPFVLPPDPALTEALADIDTSDEAALAAVLAHPDPRARVALVDDSGDLLDHEPTWARLLADPSPAVRAAAVRCSDCPLPMPASERHPGVRASSRQVHPWELALLAAHPEPAVRAAVARNLAAPPRVLCELARDPMAEVRHAVAWPLCLAAFSGYRGDAAARRALEALAQDVEVSIRLEVGRSVEFLAPEG